MVRIARAIDKAMQDEFSPLGQMIIVCGRNERVRKRLSRMKWSIPTAVHGFVDNVPALMAQSHVLVTKAGPSTIIESINNGLPILLTGYIPGQETGNVDFVVNRRVGLYSPDPRQIGRAVHNWLVANPCEREQFAQRALRLAQPETARRIVQEVAEHIGVSSRIRI